VLLGLRFCAQKSLYLRLFCGSLFIFYFAISLFQNIFKILFTFSAFSSGGGEAPGQRPGFFCSPTKKSQNPKKNLIFFRILRASPPKLKAIHYLYVFSNLKRFRNKRIQNDFSQFCSTPEFS